MFRQNSLYWLNERFREKTPPTQQFKINEANLNEDDMLETYIVVPPS